MVDPNVMLTCTRCSKKSSVKDMKYNKAGVLVCAECNEKQKDEPIKTTTKSYRQADYKNYICAECRYKFKLRNDFPVRRCPFCGKSQIIEDKNISADDLLLEADDPRFEK